MTRVPPVPFIERNPLNFRGTNYVASIAYGTDKVLGMLPFPGRSTFRVGQDGGFFDPQHNEDEILALATYGINNIRLWGSFWAWVLDAPGYLQSLATIARNCLKYGISITYVLWSTTATLREGQMSEWVWGNRANVNLQLRNPQNWSRLYQLIWGYTAGNVARAASEGRVPEGEPWLSGDYDEPGNALFRLPHTSWDPSLSLRPFIDAYLQDLATFFGAGPGAPVIASYDLFNEADVDLSRDDVRVSPRDNRLLFIQETYSRLRMHHATVGSRLPPCTVGWAFMSDYSKEATRILTNMGVAQGYLSSHSYAFPPLEFRQQIRDARDFAAARGLPYVCSEFWARRVPAGTSYPRTMAAYLDAVSDELVGSQVWGFLAYNLFDIVNGVPQPTDGFITPEKHVFTPLRIQAADLVVQPPLGGLLEPHPWPRRVLVDLTPPVVADVAAVQRWTRGRGASGVAG